MPPAKARANRRKKNAKNASIVEDVTEAEWFLTNASKSGEVLRKLHLKEDGRRLDFIEYLQEFLEEDPSEDDLHGLYEGRLPQVLMDIASDRSLYKEFAADDDIVDYLTGAHSALSTMIRHTVLGNCEHEGHQAGGKHPWARYVLQQYPHLWNVVAEFPELIKYDGTPPVDDEDDPDDEGDDSLYRDGLTNLLMSHNFLSMQDEGHFPSLLSSQGGYIAMLCWVHSCNTHCRDHLIVSQVAYFSGAGEFATNVYLDRILARGTITPQDYINHCCSILCDEDLLNEYLWTLLKEEDELPFLILYAAQRQVCSGEDHEVYRVLRAAFNQLGNILSEDNAVTLLKDLREFSHYMVLLLARALVPAAQDEDIDDIEGMFTVYNYNAESLNEHSDPDDEDDFRADVRRVWHRTREDLEKLSPSVAPRRSQIIKMWTEFGEKCGVDVDAPFDPSAEFKENGKHRSRAKRCAWRECLCFGERPKHSLRMCKRCTKVLYCSSKCQKRDWNEGGHKRVCRPPES